MRLPTCVDGRTPEELRSDGDDRWPNGSRYTPPHLEGDARRAYVARQDELDQLPAPEVKT